MSDAEFLADAEKSNLDLSPLSGEELEKNIHALLKATEVGIADELAAAASLLMGQGSEGLPAVHVRGFPLAFRPGSVRELIRNREIDLFR